MTPWWTHLIGVLILVLMATFIGIWIWAWNARHKPAFDRLSRLPMEDDPAPQASAPENPR